MRALKVGLVALVALVFAVSAAEAQSRTWSRIRRERAGRKAQAKVQKNEDGSVTILAGCPLGSDSSMRVIFFGGVEVAGPAVPERVVFHVAHRVAGNSQAFATYRYTKSGKICVAGVWIKILKVDQNQITFERVEQ